MFCTASFFCKLAISLFHIALLDSADEEAPLTLIMLPEELQFAAVRFLGAGILGARCANPMCM